MDTKEFARRFSGSTINLAPEEEKLTQDDFGVLIQLDKTPLTTNVSQLLHVLKSESHSTIPKQKIYLKIADMGAYEVGEEAFTLDKYKRILSIFSMYGVELFKLSNGGEQRVELDKSTLFNTVKFNKNNDISLYI